MLTQDSFSALWCPIVAAAISILFNLAESSAVYLDDSALRNQAASGDKRAIKLEKLLGNHDRLKLSVYVASVLCLCFSVLCLVNLSVAYCSRTFNLGITALSLAHWGFALGYTLLFFALAVYAPRRIASYFPEMAFSLSQWLSLFAGIALPLSVIVGAVSSLAIRLLGKDPHMAPASITEEEIRMLVDEGNERGTIEESEKTMINNIFEFDDRDVSQVMTHRTELSAVDVRSTLDEVARVAMESGYSRLPVYDGDIDTVCGIIYAKDLIKYIHCPQDFHLSDNMRKPIFVPESGSCSAVFALLQREKTQIAIVVDEYGGTYGIVTVEDLLESIVGNIQDEFDKEESLATKIDEGVYLLDGYLSISDAEQLLDFYVPDDSEADTLSGFVIELLGGVPHESTDSHTVTFSGITFTVIRCDEKRIEKIRAVINSDSGKE